MGFKKFILIISILFAFSGLLLPINFIYAKSAQDTLTIHTIWVTGNNSCYYNDVQRMNEFHKEVIMKYLQAYGLDFYYYPSECMTQWEYDSYESPDYTDLVVVIYNKNVGRDVLHAKNIGGFFEWSNTENKNASSGWMKPKPLVGLKNFTVPVVDIMSSRGGVAARNVRAASKYLWERTESASRKRTTDRPKVRSTPALWA